MTGVAELTKIGDLTLARAMSKVSNFRIPAGLEYEPYLDTSKHNGSYSFVAMPLFWDIEGMPDCEWRGGDGTHKYFHEYIQSHGIWTLIYSPQVMAACAYLNTRPGRNLETLLDEIAVELHPAWDNPYLARAHGRPGVYTAGCHGPLCRHANTQAQRRRYGAKLTEGREDEEACLTRVCESYTSYLHYLRHIRGYRLLRHDNLKLLSLKDTLLIDVTDEVDRSTTG